MAHTLDVTRLEEIYEGIFDHLERLNPWERRFIDDTYEQWTRTEKLSSRQLESLEKIHLKV